MDLGTRKIALACPEIEMVWSTSVDTPRLRRQFPDEFDAGTELGRRVRAFLEEWYATSSTYDGARWDGPADSLFVAERPFLRSARPNVKTATGMALSGAAALAQQPGRIVLLKHPSLWKKALSGYGNLDKDGIRAWIDSRHPALAAACGQNQDRYDACGIALGGAVLASGGDL